MFSHPLYPMLASSEGARVASRYHVFYFPFHSRRSVWISVGGRSMFEILRATQPFKTKNHHKWPNNVLGLARPAVLLLLPLVMFACQSTAPEPTPTATPTPTPTPTLISSSTLETPLSETLFLEIAEPPNESIVTVSTVMVRGRTTPDAVVSINGETVEVNVQGDFSLPLSPEPGPNLIEVVASDLDGKQQTAILAIIFVP